MKTLEEKAKEFIENEHFNLKLDCPNHVSDISEAMADFAKALLEEAAEKIDKEAIDFYLWMNTNNYDHNIRQRVQKKYEIFKRNGAF